ncbi:MAG: prolipoprotein diacylglyceryl transferase [bacterium]
MHPVLFKIGSLTLYTYGLFLAIAFMVGFWLAERRAFDLKRHISNIGVLIFVSGIIGARIFNAISNPSSYSFIDVFISRSGFTFHGGLIFAIISVWIYCKKKGLPFLKIADIFSPSFIIGMSIGRIGCFFEGCCFGKPTSLPWGILFPVGSWGWKRFGNTPLHPTQLYSSLLDFILFLILIKIKPKRNGFVFFSFLLGYSIIRFFVEFLRDQPLFLFSLTQPQVVFFIVGIISIIWFLYGKNKQSI